LVTGVSTGALSAPFVYLGPEYDHALERVYTQTSAADIFFPRNKIVAAVTADAVTDSAPLRSMVTRFVDERMMERIAEEYGKGRLLLIMTTNLDQGRPVIWNIGAIAESRHPRARELVIDILMASSAIPGIFPPVMITVNHGGKDFHEMHVDGGTTAQTFLYPPNFRLKQVGKQKGVQRQRVAYIIRNGRLFRDETEVPRQTLSVAAQAASTMIAANGANDAFRIYLTTRRDGVAYNLAYIGDEFGEPYVGPFDQTYMVKLFAFGREQGLNGSAWHKAPPGFED
jgi:predicted acylesterase/phospholipase RssA